jgi:hypothetical protein
VIVARPTGEDATLLSLDPDLYAGTEVSPLNPMSPDTAAASPAVARALRPVDIKHLRGWAAGTAAEFGDT